MRFGYISEEDPAHRMEQEIRLRSAGCQDIFYNESSNFELVNSGDILVLVSLDQLATSFKKLASAMSELNEKGIELVSLEEGFDSRTDAGKLFGKHLSIIIDFQNERNKLGAEKAKRAGLTGGRPALMNERTVVSAQKLFDSGVPPISIARKFKVSLSTLYRYLQINQKAVPKVPLAIRKKRSAKLRATRKERSATQRAASKERSAKLRATRKERRRMKPMRMTVQQQRMAKKLIGQAYKRIAKELGVNVSAIHEMLDNKKPRAK